MALKLKTLAPVTLSSSNTAYALSTTDEVPYVSITISADSTNTGSVYLGDDTVTPTNGQEIRPGEAALINTPIRPSGSEEFHVTEIYVTTATAGSKVRIVGWRRKP